MLVTNDAKIKQYKKRKLNKGIIMETDITNISSISSKPIIKYGGGKHKEIPHFEKYIPSKINTYYEPFLGGGAVYFYLAPQKAHLADVNDNLIHFYNDLKINFDIVKQELSSLQSIYETNRYDFEELKKLNQDEHVKDKNESLYYGIRDMYNGIIPSQYHYATLYYFINKTAYSGMIRYNSKGNFNVPYGRYKNFNTSLLTNNHRKLLDRGIFKCESYENSFNLAKSDDFIFLDPPYDTTFSDYGNKKDFGETEHRKLAEDFKQLSAPALMVIADTPLIRELYSKYIRNTYAKNYSVNIRNRFNSKALHLVITNYVPVI